MGQQNSRRTSARDTSSNTRRRAMLASAIAIPLAGLLPASARAADLYYDADATGTVGGGSGNWSVSLPRWGDTSTATTYGPWVDGSSAFFGGSGGLVDVTGAVSPVAFDLSANYAFLGNNLFIGGQPTTFNTAAGTTSLIIGNVGGGLGLTKTGAGSLGFTGLMAPGAINVNEGTLFYASALSDLATANPVTVAAGATLRLGVINDGFGSLAGAGNVVLGSLPGYFGTTQGTNLDIGADNSSTTFSGNISGASGRFFKQGTGTLTLTGTNTNTGRIGVQAGILEVSGGSAISDASDVFISANSTLKLLSSERIGSVGAGTATTPKIELVNADLTLGTNTRNIQFNGVIVGTGSVTKVGSGIQQMTTAGAASTYTGGTFIKEGILLASGDAKLGQLGNGITLDGGTLSNFNTAGLALGTGATARPITVTANGGGLQALNDSAVPTVVRSVAVNGVVSGPGTLTKYGPGTLTLNNGGNTFSGGFIQKEGETSTTALTGTPLGTGTVQSTGRLRFTGNGANVTIASGAGASFLYGPGAELYLNNNVAAPGPASLTLTSGDAAAAGSTLARLNGGAMTLVPFSGVANLGNPLGTAPDYEVWKVNGGVPVKNTNLGAGDTAATLASPSIVSWTDGGNSTAEFLSYDNTFGFVAAKYSTLTDVNAADNTTVFKTTAITTNALTANRTVLALNATADVTGAGQTLTIGDGVGVAGIIVNPAASGTINLEPNIAFDGTDATFHVRNTGTANVTGTLSISGSGGLTKFGLGTLTLNTPASYTGPTNIGNGIVSLAGGNDRLPTTTALNFGGLLGSVADVTLPNLNSPTLKLNGSSQTLAGLSSTNAHARIDLGGGTLTVNQNGDSEYYGVIVGGGTLVKGGTGKVVFNPINGNNNSVGTYASAYNKLVLNGGVAEFAAATGASTSLPNNPALVSDAITFNGGTLRYASGTAVTGGQSITTSNGWGFRGVVVNAGGGTIDLPNEHEIVLWQRANGEVVGTDDRDLFTGTGDLTKTGPGFLRLGIGNSFQGRWIIKEGNLQFQNDSSLGGPLGSFKANALTLDGGTIQTNGSGVLSANRGVLVTANNAVINTSPVSNVNFTFPFDQGPQARLVVQGEISGPGMITKVGQSYLGLNAANTFAGGLKVQEGLAAFNASGSAGSGTITVDPLFATALGKIEGGDSTISNDIAMLSGAGSAIDIRVVTGASPIVGSAFNGQQTGSLTLSGKISGSANFYKGLIATHIDATTYASNADPLVTRNADGTVVLSNSTNDFTGHVGVYTGTLAVAANNALGATSGHTSVGRAGTLGFQGGINYSAAETVYIAGTGVGGTAGAIRNVAGDNTFAGPVRLSADAAIDVSAGSLNLSAGVGGAAVLTKTGGNDLTVKNVRTNGLAITGGSVSVTTNGGADGTSIVKSLSIGAGTKLNLADNDIIVDYTGASVEGAIRQYVIDGRVPLSTSGIFSTPGNPDDDVVLAVADNVDWGKTAFNGIAIDTDTVVGKYTYFGDANLDGKVTGDDYLNVDANLGTGNSWLEGDFNMSGVTTGDDYLAIDANLGKGTANPLAFAELKEEMVAAHVAMFGEEYLVKLAQAEAEGFGASVVPEPTAISLIGLGAVGLLGRRRRRRV